MGPRGGVVTQRSAKPCTPVQFWSWPPTHPIDFTKLFYSLSVPSDRIATILLPFLLLALLHGRFQRGVGHRGGIFLHPGNDVRIKVQCDPDLAMPQPFAGD